MGNNKKVLQCHSHGDKRFSALCAKVEIHNRIFTIEKIYRRILNFSQAKRAILF